MSAKCSLKLDIEGMSCFADVEFGAFGTSNYINDVINLAIKCLVTFMENLGPWTSTVVQFLNILLFFSLDSTS